MSGLKDVCRENVAVPVIINI